jgi:hypothetical protein
MGSSMRILPHQRRRRSDTRATAGSGPSRPVHGGGLANLDLGDFVRRTARNWFTAVNWLTSCPEQLAPRQVGRRSSVGSLRSRHGAPCTPDLRAPRARRSGRAHPRHVGRAGSPSLSRRPSSPPDPIVSSDRAGARLGGRTVRRRAGGVGDDRHSVFRHDGYRLGEWHAPNPTASRRADHAGILGPPRSIGHLQRLGHDRLHPAARQRARVRPSVDHSSMRSRATSWRKRSKPERRGPVSSRAGASPPARSSPSRLDCEIRTGPDFTAREWIIDAVDGWLENPHGDPIFCLSSRVECDRCCGSSRGSVRSVAVGQARPVHHLHRAAASCRWCRL